MKRYVILISIMILFSCNRKIENLYEGNFYDIVKIADSLDKNIWMILGGGEGCSPCNRIINDMNTNKLFEKYKDHFIFYKCNTWDQYSTFLQHLFLMTAVPNSYITDQKGNVISFIQSNTQTEIGAKHIEIQLKSALNHSPINELEHSEFKTSGKELLKMQNLILKAVAPNTDDHTALRLLDSSISIEPYFYNLYLKYRLLDKIGLKNDADSCANLCLSYPKAGYQIALYDSLINQTKKYSKTYKVNHLKSPKIEFKEKDLNCGFIKNNQNTDIVFNYKNIGTSPLVIIDILVSCGCMKPEWSKKPLLPGDSSQLIINYNDETKGDFYRTVSIVSNAEKNVEMVTLRGIIK